MSVLPANPLTLQAAGLEFGHVKLTFDQDDISGAGSASDTVSISGFPANAIKLWAAVHVKVAGASSDEDEVDGITVEIGDSGDPNGIFTATEVFGTTGAKGPALGSEAMSWTVVESSYSPIVTVRATHSGAGTPVIDLISALECDVYLFYSKPDVAAALGLA